jgi:hypothetical protein
MCKTLLRRLTRARHQSTSSHRPLVNRLRVESLENGTTPSTSPFVYSVFDDRAKTLGHTTATTQAVSLTGELKATTRAVPVPLFPLLAVDATLDLQFSVTADYSGSSTVAGEGLFVFAGWQGVGSFTVGVANDTLAFKVAGIGFAITLPH